MSKVDAQINAIELFRHVSFEIQLHLDHENVGVLLFSFSLVLFNA